MDKTIQIYKNGAMNLHLIDTKFRNALFLRLDDNSLVLAKEITVIEQEEKNYYDVCWINGVYGELSDYDEFKKQLDNTKETL